MTTTPQLNAYLSFRGDCEAAFRAYAQCFGGTVGELFRYGGSPMADQVPPDWADKVMHGSVTICGQVLMGADAAPAQYEAPRGISLALHIKGAAEGERIFSELAVDGTNVVPLEKTFWAERFGVVVDRFGITWSINCEH
jgi:PhnB protein